MSLPRISQSPRDPGFIGDPYPLYARMRALGPLVWWDDYALPCAAGHAEVSAFLRDRRFGREQPAELRPPRPAHLAPFYAIDDNSMLELEPPAHTRLRRLVLHAFTSRHIAAVEPRIAEVTDRLLDALPPGGCDLLPAFAERLPVEIIAGMMGVDSAMCPQLLAWSHDMVAMYQARRDRRVEDAAARAAAAFTAFLQDLIAARRTAPRDDLISHLIAARDGADRLSEAEMIATAVLLLNAGHEATVHTIGNGVKAILEAGLNAAACAPDRLTEEVLRFDPPLHMFTRYALEDAVVHGHRFSRGDEVALLLGAANRDPAAFADPDRFDPARAPSPHVAFGAGLHFCVGAPLARAELQIALPRLFERCPALRLSGHPDYADKYHFHGLARLDVTY